MRTCGHERFHCTMKTPGENDGQWLFDHSRYRYGNDRGQGLIPRPGAGKRCGLSCPLPSSNYAPHRRAVQRFAIELVQTQQMIWHSRPVRPSKCKSFGRFRPWPVSPAPNKDPVFDFRSLNRQMPDYSCCSWRHFRSPSWDCTATAWNDKAGAERTSRKAPQNFRPDPILR